MNIDTDVPSYSRSRSSSSASNDLLNPANFSSPFNPLNPLNLFSPFTRYYF